MENIDVALYVESVTIKKLANNLLANFRIRHIYTTFQSTV